MHEGCVYGRDPFEGSHTRNTINEDIAVYSDARIAGNAAVFIHTGRINNLCKDLNIVAVDDCPVRRFDGRIVTLCKCIVHKPTSCNERNVRVRISISMYDGSLSTLLPQMISPHHGPLK